MVLPVSQDRLAKDAILFEAEGFVDVPRTLIRLEDIEP